MYKSPFLNLWHCHKNFTHFPLHFSSRSDKKFLLISIKGFFKLLFTISVQSLKGNAWKTAIANVFSSNSFFCDMETDVKRLNCFWSFENEQLEIIEIIELIVESSKERQKKIRKGCGRSTWSAYIFSTFIRLLTYIESFCGLTNSKKIRREIDLIRLISDIRY